MLDENPSIFLGILAVLALIVGIIAYFVFVYPGNNNQLETLLLQNSEKDLEDNVETKNTGNESETKKEETQFRPRVLTKPGFSISIPQGWTEADPSSGSALALVVEEGQKANFTTYYSINSHSLRKYTFEEYIEEVKVGLVQTIETIDFLREEENKINGEPAFFIETKSYQQGINFRSLLVFVEGEGNVIWAISFNTLEDKWPEYRDLFYQTAKTFKLQAS